MNTMTASIAASLLLFTPLLGLAKDACETKIYPLTGGQSLPVGSVEVVDYKGADGNPESLYVTYKTTGDWYLTEVHLYVQNEAPATRLVPGHAPYKSGDIAYTQEYTFKVTLPSLACSDTIYLQAHAAVVSLVDGVVEVGETAYGGDITKPRRGAWYGNIAYTLQCCGVPESGVCKSQTAWAGNTEGDGSSWWFYYDASAGGNQPILAGQKVNAGTVVVANGTITINLTGGWKLQNVSENVKIQGYYSDELPSTRPAAGKFTTHKGQYSSTTVVINLGIDTNYDFYAIHLDVEYCQ
jgi:hypothetical protein